MSIINPKRLSVYCLLSGICLGMGCSPEFVEDLEEPRPVETMNVLLTVQGQVSFFSEMLAKDINVILTDASGAKVDSRVVFHTNGKNYLLIADNSDGVHASSIVYGDLLKGSVKLATNSSQVITSENKIDIVIEDIPTITERAVDLGEVVSAYIMHTILGFELSARELIGLSTDEVIREVTLGEACLTVFGSEREITRRVLVIAPSVLKGFIGRTFEFALDVIQGPSDEAECQATIVALDESSFSINRFDRHSRVVLVINTFQGGLLATGDDQLYQILVPAPGTNTSDIVAYLKNVREDNSIRSGSASDGFLACRTLAGEWTLSSTVGRFRNAIVRFDSLGSLESFETEDFSSDTVVFVADGNTHSFRDFLGIETEYRIAAACASSIFGGTFLLQVRIELGDDVEEQHLLIKALFDGETRGAGGVIRGSVTLTDHDGTMEEGPFTMTSMN